MGIYRDGQIFMYGAVGLDWYEEFFTALQVIEALAEHGREKDVTVRMNSGGGDPITAIAIYNALKAHDGQVTVQIDAMSASAASLIAMGADVRIMKAGAQMMIHDPSSGVWGTARDLKEGAALLDMQADEYAKLYAKASGKTTEEAREIMEAETWMMGEEAVIAGFATTHDGSTNSLMCPPFDYTQYSKAPKELVTMTRTNKWGKEPEQTTPTQEEQTKMPKTDEEIAQMVADAEAKGKADGVKEGVETYMKLQKQVMELPQAQKQPKLAESFMADGMDFEQIKAKFDLMEDNEPAPNNNPSQSEYNNLRQTGAGLDSTDKPQQPTMSAGSIYKKRRELMAS
ncbi:ATP-dependent protease ClpP, protease subunit [Pseudovibrio ascidiaceicola]|uniref:ATP-dependent Clp protease proteolytic subunit n=1 Tax=Pseudovibrio ascidiaceicola TaxID=285279 RepID=A0A1I4E342_9HYPH|nr:head maturation protease, ClpP-related [Pseudovibrio ascidiaceicola]SFK99380.1 ATP-dependent protease ClpP, protease subunit [Pseudovibrio ascidiaceicola]